MNAGSDTTVKTLRTKVAESALALTEALSGSRVLRLSIHDATGCTAWNSGDPLSTDEHEFLLDALDSFALEPSRRMLERAGTGGTGLVAFAARIALNTGWGIAVCIGLGALAAELLAASLL